LRSSALIRGVAGILLIFIGILWISLIPEALHLAEQEPTIRGWIAVIAVPTVFLTGGGFLAFYRNKLFKNY